MLRSVHKVGDGFVYDALCCYLVFRLACLVFCLIPQSLHDPLRAMRIATLPRELLS
jgi:hypothetical protein